MMRAQLIAPGKIAFQDVPVPVVRTGQLLLKIERLGICGSDIHVFHGKHRHAVFPLVQGHEVSATVVEVAEGTEGFSVGDRVTVEPQIFCGTCHPCTHGRYYICENLKVMGFQVPGCASEYVALEAAKALRLPRSISSDHGAMVEPLAVAVHALGRTQSVAGSRVLVLGAGPIGNLVAQVARAQGADSVMITDLSNHRLALARKCGIDACVNPSEVSLQSEILGRFGIDKMDVIFECVGVEQTISQAISLSRKGIDIVVVGVFGEDPPVNLANVQRRELRLIGTHMYHHSDFVRAAELIESCGVDLDPLLTDVFPFEQYEHAYRFIDEHGDKAMKVLLKVSD